MTLRIIRNADYRRMPWKNGGGVTTEILVHPAGASVEDFDWRISMATMATDGAFSSFANIDRTLSVIEGNGINLAVAGHGMTALTRASAPFSFPGDVPAGATLIEGPILDLNVMTRRGRFKHEMQRLPITLPIALSAQSGERIILLRGAAAEIRHKAEIAETADGDTIWLGQNADTSITITPRAALELHVIDIRQA